MPRFLLIAFAMAVAAPAGAAVLPFTATLEITFNGLAVSVVDSGVATVNASGGGAHLSQIEFAAGAISGTAVVPVTDPTANPPISGLHLDVANLAGTIAETTNGELRGAMGLPGVMKICLFGSPAGCVAPVANMIVPLTPVGQGGGVAVAAAVNVTVLGAPWTTGTASVGTLTVMGTAHGPASGASSTAQTGGSLRLVTPIYISTNIGACVTLVSFAILKLHFVPEPVTALLLGTGIVALGAMGRRRTIR